jgi:hypothetical protein
MYMRDTSKKYKTLPQLFSTTYRINPYYQLGQGGWPGLSMIRKPLIHSLKEQRKPYQ